MLVSRHQLHHDGCNHSHRLRGLPNEWDWLVGYDRSRFNANWWHSDVGQLGAAANKTTQHTNSITTTSLFYVHHLILSRETSQMLPILIGYGRNSSHRIAYHCHWNWNGGWAGAGGGNQQREKPDQLQSHWVCMERFTGKATLALRANYVYRWSHPTRRPTWHNRMRRRRRHQRGRRQIEACTLGNKRSGKTWTKLTPARPHQTQPSAVYVIGD